MQNVYYSPYPPANPERALKRQFRSDVGRAGGALLMSQLMMAVITYAAILIPVLIVTIREVVAMAQGTGTFDPDALMHTVEGLIMGDSMTLMLISSALASIVGLNIPLLVYANKRGIDVFALFRGGKFTAGFMLGASCLALTLNMAWGYLYAYLCELFPVLSFDFESTALDFPTDSIVDIILYVFLVCIVAPIFEEIAFRGVLLKALCRYGTVFGILTTSLFFGLFHGNIAQTPATFLIALVLGYAAVKTGDIKCSILIHAFNNTFATIFSALYAFFPDAEWTGYADLASSIMLAAGAVIFLICRPGWIPVEGRKPAIPTVKHRYFHFFTTPLNVFFIVLFLFVIVMGLDFESVGIDLYAVIGLKL